MQMKENALSLTIFFKESNMQVAKTTSDFEKQIVTKDPTLHGGFWTIISFT